MRIWTAGIVLIAAGVMFQPTAPAQSIWQKMKTAAKQVETNAEAQSRQAHAAQQTHTNAPAAASAQPAAAAGGSTSGASSPAADLSSPAMKALYRKLDVGGVQMGMTPKQAQAAIQSRNRDLVPSSTPFGYTDLPNTSFTSEIAFSSRSGSSAEAMDLGLTVQPMQPQVLSIYRFTQYNENNVSTIANTVAALRAKYGPETKKEVPSATSQDTNMVWIFDGAGRLLPASRVQNYGNDIFDACGAAVNTMADARVSLRSGLENGGNIDCAPYTTLRVAMYEWRQTEKNSHGQTLPRGMLENMKVTLNSNPLLTKTVNATLDMLIAAKNGRQQKEKKAADQRAAPL